MNYCRWLGLTGILLCARVHRVGAQTAAAQSPDRLVTATAAPSLTERELRIGKLRADKVLFLGNSITLHGPAPAIGWNGNWGMAATAKEKDYVHLLLSRLAKAAGGEPKVMIKNIADFERKLSDYTIQDELKGELDFAADIVVIAIGENAAALKTDEAKARYETAFRNLLVELKQHGQPTIFVRSAFWPDVDKDQIMKLTCEAVGGTYVDISQLSKEEANYARAEQKLDHAGVAGHPGDTGVQALANAIWQAIQKKSM